MFSGKSYRIELLLSFSSPEAALPLSAPRIATSGRLQHQKSTIHGNPVTLRMLRVKSDKSNLVPRAHVSFGQRQDPCLGADQKTHGLWERDWTNLVGSSFIILCLQSQSEPESHWTCPEVIILGADQKERGHWGRECSLIIFTKPACMLI